jgi:sulfhydrogenase subunit beta (sulfur reductase)
MEHFYRLDKSHFEDLFEEFKRFGQVFAPVRVSTLSYSFKEVSAVEQICFEALRTILPPKKFFYAQTETLVRYSRDAVQEVLPETVAKVIFGAHPCDLNGLKIIDKVFTAEPGDTHYAARRNQTLIVGLSCMPDQFCFCKSMGTDVATDVYDMFLTDLDDSYFIQVRTALGQQVLEPLKDRLLRADDADKAQYRHFMEKRSKSFERGFDGHGLRTTMEMEANNNVWQELGERCLSCGNCTPVCPTCYCFDIVDIAQLNGDSGERRREWDSCQFSGFAKVAGDVNFRPTPVDRLKFWYQHKLHGFEDAYEFPTCVGCGRCTVSCPAGIDDIVGVVIRLQQQQEHKQEETTQKDAGGAADK